MTKGKVYQVSDITRERQRISHLGKPGYWLGKKRSKEDRIKMGLPKKGKPISEERKEKLRLLGIGNKYNLGKKQSKETIEKRRISNTGKKRTEATKIKMSEWQKGKPKLNQRGEKHGQWKGGISSENDKARHSPEQILWRKTCLERDNFTDQKYGGGSGKLVVHHILNFSSYPELRYDITNGITLSIKSHNEFHKKYGKRNNTREQLLEFLKD